MSTLTLVRHGQAQPFQPDPDRLSELGVMQARALGGYWLRRNVAFDEVYAGSLERHRQTEARVAGVYREAGRCWPEVRIVPELNEYDAEGLLRALAPGPLPAEKREFQRVFESAMLQWIDGKRIAGSANGTPVESWPCFRDRVHAALAGITSGGPNRRVAAFTSGGPIGVLVQFALQAPERSFLEVNWRVRNTSLTEFVFSGSRFTLDSFNRLPHLDDAEMITFR